MSTTTTGTNCDSCKPVISERTLHTPIPSSAWTAFIGGANYSTERGEHCPAHTHLWLCDFSFIIAVFYCLLDSIVALRHISTAFFLLRYFSPSSQCLLLFCPKAKASKASLKHCVCLFCCIGRRPRPRRRSHRRSRTQFDSEAAQVTR